MSEGSRFSRGRRKSNKASQAVPAQWSGAGSGAIDLVQWKRLEGDGVGVAGGGQRLKPTTDV
jgi:hypothetical protein